MNLLTTYHDYYYRDYLAKGLSRTHCFCIITLYILIAIPFYFSFAGSNFWLDNHTQNMAVNYNYTGYYAIQVNTILGGSSVTDQFSNIPGNSLTSTASMLAKLTVNDYFNSASSTLQLTGYGSTQITSVNVIMYYLVELPVMSKSVVTGLMWSVRGDALSVRSSGLVSFVSQSSIPAMVASALVNLPPYLPQLKFGFKFVDLTNELISTSKMLKSNIQSTVITGQSSSRLFSLDFTKQRLVVVNYYPTILQTLKFKYSTYLAFVIISFFVFITLLKLYIKQGMLSSISQVQQLR